MGEADERLLDSVIEPGSGLMLIEGSSLTVVGEFGEVSVSAVGVVAVLSSLLVRSASRLRS